MRKNAFPVYALLMLVTLSCRVFSPNQENTPTTTPATAVSPATPVVTPTNTAANPPPTELPPSPTPAPTALNSRGPYILYQAEGIWISNPDGSFPTRITSLQSDNLDLYTAVSPTGDRLAMVVQNEKGLDLVQVSIPGGETKTLAHLLDLPEDELRLRATSNKAFIAYAILKYKNLAWQPGTGRLLAFTGATQGPTSDLYTVDTTTGEIKRLTNGPSQAIMPYWSPDGRYILHFGGSWVPPFGGAIGGYTRLDGAWAVRVEDSQVLDEPLPQGMIPNFVGWQDDAHYITYDSSDACYSENLRSVDIATGKTSPLMKYSFYYGAERSPENGAILFAGKAGCPSSPGDGLFLLPAGASEPVRLLEKKAYELRWMPESRLFLAYPEALFGADGKTRYDPPVYDSSFQPAVSKNGYQAWEVIENRQGRVVVRTPGQDWHTIQTGLVKALIWDPLSGNTLLISLEKGDLYAAAYPDFTPRKMGNLGAGASQAIWIP